MPPRHRPLDTCARAVARWSGRLGVLGAAIVVLATPAHAASGVVGGEALAATGVVVDLGPGALPPPETEAASYVIADLESGAVLAAKSAHQQLPPASTLKVLTALTLLPELDKDQVVLGTNEEMLVEGSKSGVAAGLSYTVDLLFTAMLLDSGNDATHALARVGGGVERTVASMNALAQELHALDTVAVDPSGLDEPGQLTSAYDLALITRAALQRDDFRAYSMTPTADLPTQDGTTYQIQNGDRLLGAYDGLLAGKNGYTTLARHTYVGAAERDGRAFVVTVMRTEGRAEAVAAALLDWAFVNADAVAPVGSLVEPMTIPEVSASAPAPQTPQAGPTTTLGASAAVVQATPAAASDEGPGAMTAVGVVAVGLVGTVAALRVRAVRRQRARHMQIQRSHAARRRA